MKKNPSTCVYVRLIAVIEIFIPDFIFVRSQNQNLDPSESDLDDTVDPVVLKRPSFYLHPSSFSYLGSRPVLFSFYGGLHKVFDKLGAPTY